MSRSAPKYSDQRVGLTRLVAVATQGACQRRVEQAGWSRLGRWPAPAMTSSRQFGNARCARSAMTSGRTPSLSPTDQRCTGRHGPQTGPVVEVWQRARFDWAQELRRGLQRTSRSGSMIRRAIAYRGNTSARLRSRCGVPEEQIMLKWWWLGRNRTTDIHIFCL